MIPTIQEFREQAQDFLKRNTGIDVAERDMIVTYMATFAYEVLKLREAGINWRDGTIVSRVDSVNNPPK